MFSVFIQYLLYYLKSLDDWLTPSVVKKVPIAKTAWALLRDSYHGNICLRYKSQHIAVSVLYLTLQCYGIEVPCNNQSDTKWWQVRISTYISIPMCCPSDRYSKRVFTINMGGGGSLETIQYKSHFHHPKKCGSSSSPTTCCITHRSDMEFLLVALLLQCHLVAGHLLS